MCWRAQSLPLLKDEIKGLTYYFLTWKVIVKLSRIGNSEHKKPGTNALIPEGAGGVHLIMPLTTP